MLSLQVGYGFEHYVFCEFLILPVYFHKKHVLVQCLLNLNIIGVIDLVHRCHMDLFST